MLSTLRWALPFWRRPFPYSQSTITGTTGARRKVLIQGENYRGGEPDWVDATMLN